jgi:DNA-binding NarL/FixJ family response regulator
VLGLLRAGLSTAEIAARLSISQVTVRRHVARMLKSLRVSNREAAVRLLDGD